MPTLTLPIGQIHLNDDNPRILKDARFQQLVKSLQDFPEMLALRPCVVDETYTVLGGNMRLRALQHLGYTEVPVVVAEGLTPEQKREFVIKDNGSFGEWDWDALANGDWPDAATLNEWGVDVPADWGVVEELPAAEEGEPDLSPPSEPITVLGDLYELNGHRVLCGDSTDSDAVGAKLLQGKLADMVFTDPPYNIGFGGTMSRTTKNGVQMPHVTANAKHADIHNDEHTPEAFNDFMKEVLSNIQLFCKGGWYISFSSSTLHELLLPMSDIGMEYKSIIIWVKNQSNIGGGDYKRRYEPIVYGYNEHLFHGTPYEEEDVWEFQKTLKNDLHPTMKPVPLVENALTKGSKQGGSVLDLFLGSGTTLIAAEGINRTCYGMELEPKYCDVIVRRWLRYMADNNHPFTVKRNGTALTPTELADFTA
jgi:DNA modification methylase